MIGSATKSKIKVGVLRGGPSGEYEVSLKTGANVLQNLLLSEKYHPKDIFISKGGDWHIDGVSRDPGRILGHVDVVFNALHGEYGEDGRVQQILESYGTPYTGSKTFPSALAMNKALSKKYFKQHGLLTPRFIVIRQKDRNPEILKMFWREYPELSVVKPVSAGSSLGVHVATNSDSFISAVEDAFNYSDTVMVEEFIVGREATCGVLDSSIGNEVYALAPIEIINPSSSTFFDYNAKYSDGALAAQEICPGNFTHEESEEIMDLARRAHKVLGLSHYSRSDFMVNPGGIYILETNTLPGLTSASLFPKALAQAGCSFNDFLDHLLTLALR